MRQQAREEKKWNAALDNMAQEVANADDDDRLEMQFEFAQLLSSAGQLEQALDLLVQVKAVTNHPQVIMNYGEVLGKLGNLEALEALQADPAVRAVVVRAEGPARAPCFCAGGDVKELAGLAARGQHVAAAVRRPAARQDRGRRRAPVQKGANAQELYTWLETAQPLPRLGRPEEVAALVEYALKPGADRLDVLVASEASHVENAAAAAQLLKCACAAISSEDDPAALVFVEPPSVNRRLAATGAPTAAYAS